MQKYVLVTELSLVSANSNVLKAMAMGGTTAMAEKGMVFNALDSFYKLIFAFVL